MALSRLSIDLGVNLAGFESDMGRAATMLQKDVAKMERQIAMFSRAAGVALGGAVVAGFVQATRAAVDFERSMAEVSTLLNDTTSLDSMTESVKDLSKEFGKAPTEQAAALYQIISSGAEAGTEAIEILTATNKLAVGGVTDLKTAADGLTSVLNVYGNEAGTVSEISDKFFAAMKAGKTTVGELAGSIGPVISIAKELGVSFDELIAAGSTLTLSGNSTSQSFNSLKAALSNIVKPSADAADEAKRLGIEFNASAVQSMGLAGFLEQVEQAAGGNVESITKLFGSVEGLNAVLALTGSSADAFTQILTAIQNAAGQTEKAVSDMQETAEQAFNRLAATIKVELIEAGAVILDKLVPAIQALSENIDFVINLIKSFAALLAGVYINRVLLAATTTGQLTGALSLLRVAFISLGGPVILAATAIASVVTGYQRMKDIMADANKDISASTNLLIGQADALRDVADAAKLAALNVDLGQKYKELGTELSKARAEYQELAKAFYDSVNLTGENSQQTQALAAEMAALEQHVLNTRKVYDAYGKELAKVAEITEETAKATKKQVQEVLTLEQKLKALGTAEVKVTQDTKDLAEHYQKLADEFEAGKKALEEYNEQLQNFVDIGDPVGALVREFEQQLTFANEALAKGKISAQQYQDTLNVLTDELGRAAAGTQEVVQQTDTMTEAMLEGVRILERSFQNVWENIFSGSEATFDGIKDGFQSMLASLQNAASTRKIFLQIENAFDPTKSVDFKMLGEGLASLAGQLAGGALGGGGQYANIGAGLGALAGSLIPGLGTILGPIIGGALGGLLGGLFDSDRPAILQVSGFDTVSLSKSDTDNLIDSAFGQTFLRSRRVAQADIEQFMSVIADFDNGLAEFLDQAQITRISEALQGWSKTIEGETLSAEQLLESRFATILSTFTADIQDFVNQVSSLEDQASRLQVGVSAESLFGAQPELFSGRTVAEFLSVVDAMQTGAETIIDTFNRVVTVIDGIIALTTFLGDFAGSDLGSEFDALLVLQNLNVGEQLARVNSELMDAIAGFDGSVSGLEEIASLITSVREGEIRYLSQLDQIQKGMNASLDQLRTDITGLTAAPKTGADFFNEARDLVAAVLTAGSAEEIAALQQQFNSLIRGIDEQDQISLQGPILQLINSFQNAANDVIGDFRDDALDNAATMRDMVEALVNDVGDPLTIIAATNERAAAALEAIANGRDPNEPDPLDPIAGEDQVSVADSIVAASELAAENQSRILEEGMRELAQTMAAGSNFTASALVAAIQNGNFQVHITVRENDLVTR